MSPSARSNSLGSFCLASLLCVVTACGGDDLGISVDLVTDYLPGRQFGGVLVELRDESGALVQTHTALATTAQDYLAGVRLVDFDELSAGTLSMHVALLADGSELASTSVIVELSASRGVTVPISSLCQRVTCPDGEDPTLTTCVGGRCVDPRCTRETLEFCGGGGCVDPAQCASSSACTEGSCVEGICFVRANDSMCAATEYCDLDRGCLFDPSAVDSGPLDGGVSDAGATDAGAMDSASPDAGPDAGNCTSTETACGDGVDDDCDGDIDCADSDCNDVACDDGTICTQSDRCTAGVCTGAPLDCSDGDVCTDDICDSATGCTHPSNTAPCDDGSWCNGTDVCAAGECTHVDPPCEDVCTESPQTCLACLNASDCGEPEIGEWSACGGFTGLCDSMGTRTRTVTSPACNGGACEVVLSEQSESCERVTTGDFCRDPELSAWGACGGFAGCSAEGVETRTQTNYACQADVCAVSSTTPITRPCSRTVTDSTVCGIDRHCCGGTCTDTSTEQRCGTCTVQCAAGLTCEYEDEGHLCVGCSSDGACRQSYDNNATCAAPRCACGCPGGASTCDGGCGEGFYCLFSNPDGYCFPDS